MSVSDRIETPPLLALGDPRRIRVAAIICAAGLIGFAIVLWIAANWVEWGRFTRFGSIASILAIAATLAVFSARFRTPACLIVMFAIGALFAAIGQTYQAVADPWPLFAAWAIVGLPLALAARSDVIWSVWVAIVYTALSLWLVAFGWHIQTNALIAWSMAAFVAVALHPSAGLKGLLGSSLWASRFALVALLLLLVGPIVSGPASSVMATGVLALGVVVFSLALVRPFELPLMGGALLALDVALIGTIIKSVSVQSLLGAIFGFGLVCVVVFVVSAYALLELAKSKGYSPSAAGMWPVMLLSGIGAVITAVPIFLFLGLFLGQAFFEYSATAYIFGAVFLGLAGLYLLRAPSIGFSEILAVIFSFAGLAMLLFALFRDLSFAQASAVLAVGASVAAFFSGNRWVAAMLGAIAAVFAGLCVYDLMPGSQKGAAVLPLSVLGAIGLYVAARSQSERSDATNKLDGFASGWSGLALFGALFAVGPTFLVSGPMSAGIMTSQSLELGLALTPPRGFAVILVVLSLAIGLRLLGRIGVAALGGAAVAAVLSYAVPTFAAPVVIWSASMITGRRVLAIAAVGAALWVLGSFYYWLGLPLLTKAVGLGALGALLGVATLIGGGFLKDEHGANSGSSQVGNMQRVLPIALIFGSLGLTAVLASTTIRSNEAIIAEGRTIYIALAPLDPRSRVQGDYMTLRFEMPRQIGRRGPKLPTWAVAELDNRNIATIRNLGDVRVAPNQNTVAFRISWRRGQPIVGTNAFFFQEGTASIYEGARFGRFRLGPDGDIILVGLTGEHLEPLGRPLL